MDKTKDLPMEAKSVLEGLLLSYGFERIGQAIKDIILKILCKNEL